MSKGLNQYHGKAKSEVILRRIAQGAGGIGTWAAKDALKYGVPKKKQGDEQDNELATTEGSGELE